MSESPDDPAAEEGEEYVEPEPEEHTGYEDQFDDGFDLGED